MLKLKKLEVQGFKSFCDKEELAFPGSGIASVVGPNGCGKSNILDAMSWVLGEQSAKSLRGARMQDVIFNGSRDRQPAGLATVSITMHDIEAANGHGPNGHGTNGNGSNGHGAHGNGLNGYGNPKRPGEVAVTRRLFRSGESQYLINGKNARLRDIQNLFMGTGLGPNHYAIIEQGRIGQVLSSKPLDRRSIIEEAAGVTKFKSRKRLAELKLESARQNLNRVNDILQEVTRQATSLKRQAAKAQRWAEFREQFTGALSALLASRHRRMSADLKAAQEAIVAADAEYKQRAERAEELDVELSVKREEQQAAETELQSGREELARLSVEIERLRARIEQQTRTAAENENRKRHAEAEIVSINERLAELEKELAAEQAAVETVAKQSQEIQARLSEKTSALDKSRHRINERQREQETSRKRVMALMHEASTLRNQLAKVEEFLAGNERHLSRVREEEAAARAELEQYEKDRADIAERSEQRRQELEAHQKRAKEVDAQIEALKQEGRRRRNAADELQRDLSRLRARRESLEEILSHHAYTTETVKNLFAAIQRGTVKDFKPIGILADIVDVEPKYERATEEFLREELEFIVVENWAQASAGVELLRGEVEGRATFLVHPEKPVPSELPALGPEAGVTGRLADHVHLQNGLSESASTLLPKLRGCYLVEEEETARKLAVRYPDLYFLLPTGLCYRGYTISGGRKGSAGPLALKRELRELIPRLAEAEKAFEENRKAAEEAEVQAGIRSNEREKLRAEIQTVEKAVVGLEHELRQLNDQTRRAERRVQVAAQDVARLGKEAERAAGERDRAQGTIDRCEAERKKAEESLEALREQLEADQEAVRGLAEEQTSLRTEAATLEERRRAAAGSLGRLRHLINEQQQRRQRIQGQTQSWEAERVRLLEDNEKLTQTITESDARQKTLTARVAELSQKLVALRTGNVEMEAQMKKLRLEVEESRQKRSKLDIDMVQLQSDLKHLAETCERELSRPLEEVSAQAPENLTPEQLAEAEERYHDVKEKIERLGPVNVLALEEFEEASRRQEFLETQQKDLLASIRDTQEAIHEIDNASKRQFHEAFEHINANFKAMFTRLFGGGVGEMRLTDPENPGESGIDIVASPPGKRLQNVLLLSGGEKSLTALALLMATFHYKPSPFCVLDEVDAALDEPNIIRFKRLLEDMADRTQFVVITHSKTTMQAAESLFGVTMQEPGVSKLVSVRMADHRGDRRQEGNRPLAPEPVEVGA